MAESLGQIKSKERVSEHGEVFTAEREVKAMCDLVKTETERIDSRFLEPACGDGNFLIEILSRKMAIVKKKYRRSAFDYERMALLAVASLYGVDILEDNVVQCRKRLYDYWNKQYTDVLEKRKECNDDTRASAQFILSRNIVCGNALTLHCVDADQKDTDRPIVFSEWSFPRNDAFMLRKDYTFDLLLSGKAHPGKEESPSIFKEAEPLPKVPKEQQLTFDFFAEEPASNPGVPTEGGSIFIKQIIAHYRRIAEHA